VLAVPIILGFGMFPDRMPRLVLGALWLLTWLAGLVTPRPGSLLAATPLAIPWVVVPIVLLAALALHNAVCRGVQPTHASESTERAQEFICLTAKSPQHALVGERCADPADRSAGT
jgi:hypothetical protein